MELKFLFYERMKIYRKLNFQIDNTEILIKSMRADFILSEY